MDKIERISTLRDLSLEHAKQAVLDAAVAWEYAHVSSRMSAMVDAEIVLRNAVHAYLAARSEGR